MSEQEADSDRTTAADRVPIDDDHLPPRRPLDRISLHRRQARSIVPPRKWRKIGLRQIVCPECRAIVGGVSDGFWHLQTAHNQGEGVDLEAWGQELRAELDEYIDAAEGRTGYVNEHQGSRGAENLSSVFVGLFVLMAVIALIGVLYVVSQLHH